jgi:hypothetical protein
MRLHRFPFAMLGLLACSGGAASPDAEGNDENLTAAAPSADEAKACQTGSVGKNAAGDAVVHCTLPFADAPFVRLPADKMTSTKATFYGGATLPTDYSGAFVIWGRDGKMYLPVDSSNAPIAYADGAKKLPKGMHAPTNRMTVTIYQFAGKLGGEVDSPYGKATAFQISAARPVVEIDGCAFDSRLRRDRGQDRAVRPIGLRAESFAA